MNMLVGGAWQSAASGRAEEVTSPFDGAVIGTVPVAGADDVRAALDRAEYGAATWRRTPAFERMRILMRAAELADERAEQTAQIISAEAGKTIAEARGEAGRSGDLIRLAAFEGTHLYGDALPLDANRGTGLDKIGFTIHQPVGIVVAITPFNYPALLVMHKLAPALAAGNAVVLKPARTTPLTTLALARCFTDAGLPDGVLSVLTGPGGSLGDALVTDPRVRKVSFTRSTVLTDPADTGAVVISLPQDIQSHAYDWPAGFFAERDWSIRRPQPDRDEIDAVLALLTAAARPLIIAGGGVIYSGATAELERLAGTAGIPVLETFAGKGAVQQRAWWQIGGIGLKGTPAANTLARDAVLTQGQVIGVLQEHARPGDVVIAAAGTATWSSVSPAWGYEIPAAIGVRLADAQPGARVVSFLGDGTFLLAPTEMVTAAQEGLAVTLVVPDNRGYQVIHRLQMLRSGREFGNEFRYRPERLQLAAGTVTKAPRLEGDYLRLDLVQVAAGLGTLACRATTAAELRDALTGTRGHPGPVVIVVPVIPHADPPGAGGEEQIRGVVPAAYGVPIVVRVESAARIRICRVLDSGAAGIMLPRLNTVDEVAEAVRHLRYPPAGDRGVATYNRACRFGLDPGALDRANAEVLGVVQVESAIAVGDAGQIAGLDGVDVLFVGPRDLSHDLGVPGDLTAPAFIEATEHVLAACRRHGKACGLLVTDGAAAELGRARTSSKPQ